MNLWIFITIAAAFVQNLRSVTQKSLKKVMGNTGATFVRFGFGLPFAWSYWFIIYFLSGQIVPKLHAGFFFWVTIAGLAQIIATFLLISLFSLRNFTVGTAYSRTEPIQTAFFAFAFFGESLPLGGIIAIIISMIGVMLISVARSSITLVSMAMSLFSRPAVIGLSSGLFFGLAAVSFRAATLRVEHPMFVMQAATTLSVGILLQSVVMLLWMILRDREELGKIREAWKPSILAGLFGATASFGWFCAFALQKAALVKVVAQIEIIFTYLSSVFYFKEKINRIEIIGCLLIVSGIIILLLWR